MEIIVIGAGPGGYVAALYAAKRGLKVALVEKAEVGGTCLNRGCIPTKTILHSANMFRRARDFADLGINASVEGIDYAKISRRRADIVERLRGGVEMLLKRAGVSVVRGEASLVGARQVRIAGENGEQILSADRIILATGAAPASLSAVTIDGDTIMNSDHALALDELPGSMAIIGGGVIGCEFAQAFARLGCEVTVIEAMPQLLPGMDADISALLQKSLERDNVRIHLNSRVSSVHNTGNGVAVAFDSAEGEAEVAARKLLVAVGRKPGLDSLGLESAGVAPENGFVKVNSQMQTGVSGIYAVGDMTGGIQLAHAASFGGIVAVKDILGESADMSCACVPMCIYTEPEIACAGLSFTAAQNAGYDCRSGVFPLTANPRALIEGASDGFSKMVLDSDGTILGASLAGPNVTEMISLLGGLINFQTTAADMEEIIFAHPSVSEIIGEGVLSADKMALHIP